MKAYIYRAISKNTNDEEYVDEVLTTNSNDCVVLSGYDSYGIYQSFESEGYHCYKWGEDNGIRIESFYIDINLKRGTVEILDQYFG